MSPSPAPVRCAADALAVIAMALSRPLAHETICFALDVHGVGGVAVAIDGTEHPDDVLDVVGIIGRAARGTPAASLVVASVRPEAALLVGDDLRWHLTTGIAHDHSLELLEWFVIGTDQQVHLPRELTGQPMRWDVLADPHHQPPGAAEVLGVWAPSGAPGQPNSTDGSTT